MRISLPALLSLFVIVSHTLLSCVQRWHSHLIPLMLAVVCWVSANTAEQCCLYMWHHKLVVVPFKWKLEKLLLSLLPQFNLIHQSKYTFNWIAWLASILIEYIFNLFRGSYLWSSQSFFFLSMAALRATNTKLSDWLLELFQPIRLWLSELPYRAKWMVPSERALKIKSETGVKSFTPFCWGSSLWKTNSVVGHIYEDLGRTFFDNLAVRLIKKTDHTIWKGVQVNHCLFF